MSPPGTEPGIFCLLAERVSRYTEESLKPTKENYQCINMA